MAVFRVERTSNYTVMSNYHLRDKTISFKAKGLLSLMLSLPENWDYTLAGLARISLEGKDAIRAAVVELEKAGYVQRHQTTDKAGKFSSNEYIIREYPASHELPPEGPSPAQPLPENPTTDFLATGSTQTENPTQINKDPVKKEKKITDPVSTESFPFPSALVVASSASLASPQAAKLTRCAAPALPTANASLVCGGDPKGRNLMDEMRWVREEIRENIDYEGLVWDHPCDSDIFNGYVELMVEACCSTGENVRICGQDFPTAVVRSRFLKLGTSKRTLSPPSTMPRSP